MTAIAYVRVSSKGQVDGDGFERQRIAIASFAKTAGFEVSGEHSDDVSGTLPLAERPGLSAVFEKATRGEIGVVIVESASRLARDLVQGELILREFRAAGVRVLAADGGADLTAGDDRDPTAKLIRQVLGAVAEFEKNALVLKLRAARARKKLKSGRCEGQKPYGQTPEEIAALHRLRQLARKPRGRKRRSLRKIAEILTSEGFATRGGGPWHRSTVHGLLARMRA